jgi:uncharacterized OB-fold protein
MSDEPDPRPTLVLRDGRYLVEGVTCDSCGFDAIAVVPRCGVCADRTRPRYFGPEGRVWSWTMVAVDVDGREAPYPIAYLDLDGGPRVLVHPPREHRPRVGDRLRLTGRDELGDVTADVMR